MHKQCATKNSSLANSVKTLIKRAKYRVSFETNFDSKLPKLESKLVSALSETNCFLFLFLFYIETASFDVSVKSKQTETS